MEQVRLSESPSRKMPEGGTIRTVGATVEERYKEWVSLFTQSKKILHENKTDRNRSAIQTENRRKSKERGDRDQI